MFEHISIMGRVAYCISSLEEYFSENGYDLSAFSIIFNALWSFKEMKYIDDYMYKVIECTPDTILDEREKFDEFEYFTVEELGKIKLLYKSIASNNMQVVQYLFDQINEILGFHMYAGNTVPAQYSLDIMEQEVYPYIKAKIKNCPNIEDFKSYDIRCDGCWGIPK